MRTTQFIGHTNAVDTFLSTCTKKETIGAITGMFDELVDLLYSYQDDNGDIWEEFVQHEPWSSGPMIYTAIRNLTTNEIKGWKPCPFNINGYEFDLNKGEIYMI